MESFEGQAERPGHGEAEGNLCGKDGALPEFILCFLLVTQSDRRTRTDR